MNCAENPWANSCIGNIPKAGQKCIETYNNCLSLFLQTCQQQSSLCSTWFKRKPLQANTDLLYKRQRHIASFTGKALERSCMHILIKKTVVLDYRWVVEVHQGNKRYFLRVIQYTCTKITETTSYTFYFSVLLYKHKHFLNIRLPGILHFQANVLQQGQQSTNLSVSSSISCSNAGFYVQVRQIGRNMMLMGELGGTIAVAVTFCCLFFRMEQEVRKVAIWWAFISRLLPEWLNVSWRWSCRQLRGRAGPGPGSATRLFIIPLKGRSTVQWITLTTKLTACSLSAGLHFTAVQLQPNPLPVPAWDYLRPKYFRSYDPIFSRHHKWLLTAEYIIKRAVWPKSSFLMYSYLHYFIYISGYKYVGIKFLHELTT